MVAASHFLVPCGRNDIGQPDSFSFSQLDRNSQRPPPAQGTLKQCRLQYSTLDTSSIRSYGFIKLPQCSSSLASPMWCRPPLVSPCDGKGRFRGEGAREYSAFRYWETGAYIQFWCTMITLRLRVAYHASLSPRIQLGIPYKGICAAFLQILMSHSHMSHNCLLWFTTPRVLHVRTALAKTA
jgi:hypothetical protein